MQEKQPKQKLETRDIKSGALTYTQYKVGDTFYDLKDMQRMVLFGVRDANRLAAKLRENPSNNKLAREFQSTFNRIVEFDMNPDRKIKEDGFFGNETVKAVQEVESMAEKLSSDLLFNRISRDRLKLNMDIK